MSYQPILTTVVTGEAKPVKSDKDFEKEVVELCVKLKDTQTYEWKIRNAALKRVQYFAQFYKETGVADGQSCVSFTKFIDSVQRLSAPLAAQVLDLRSATAKEAGIAIQMLAEAMNIEFEQTAFKLAAKETLGKLMHNGTKILAEIGASTLISIVINVCSIKIIQRLQQEL